MQCVAWRLHVPPTVLASERGDGVGVAWVQTPPYPHPPLWRLTSPSSRYAVIHSSKYLPNTPGLFPNPHTPGVYIFLKKDLRTFALAFKLVLFKHLTKMKYIKQKMTPRRQLVLDFIKAYIRIHGIAPSYEVIAKGLKMKSKANIHRIVHRLQDDGYVSIRPHKFHSIKVVDRSVKEISAL